MHFFVGEYDASMKISEGGGVEDETENIEGVAQIVKLNYI